MIAFRKQLLRTKNVCNGRSVTHFRFISQLLKPPKAFLFGKSIKLQQLYLQQSPQLRQHLRTGSSLQDCKRFRHTQTKILDGKQTANEIREELRLEVAELKRKEITPCLSVILVGTRRDSQVFVRMKQKACEDIGIHFRLTQLPESISQEDLGQIIQDFNTDTSIHGIVVQLPLPSHIHESVIVDLISEWKDVDGFHPRNMGLLVSKGRTPRFVPCTARAALELLDRYHISLSGKQVVVVGRSNVVGIPVAMLCLQRNATVTICHTKTKDLEKQVKEADVIISACGQPEIIKKEWVQAGAVIVDVGINCIDDQTKKRGYRIVGDVEEEAKEIVSFATPVPGGVGPMTVVMLLKNTILAAKYQSELAVS